MWEIGFGLGGVHFATRKWGWLDVNPHVLLVCFQMWANCNLWTQSVRAWTEPMQAARGHDVWWLKKDFWPLSHCALCFLEANFMFCDLLFFCFYMVDASSKIPGICEFVRFFTGLHLPHADPSLQALSQDWVNPFPLREL